MCTNIVTVYNRDTSSLVPYAKSITQGTRLLWSLDLSLLGVLIPNQQSNWKAVKRGKSWELYICNEILWKVNRLDIEEGHMAIIIKKNILKQTNETLIKDAIDLVSNGIVYIVVRYNYPHLDEIHNFIKKALLEKL